MATLSEWADKPARLLVFTGAGLSADSGIATFRDTGGLWENHDVNLVANGLTWRDNLDLVRRFYNERRVALARVVPNPAHHMIARWQSRYNALVLTQNIDDLLERAGCADVIHLHGKLTEMRCVACGNVWSIGYRAWEDGERCSCGSRRGVRPNVVFFNEEAREYAKMYKAFDRIGSPKDIVVVIGTSGQVIPVDSYFIGSRALCILNNLEHSDHVDESNYDHVLFGKASEVCYHIDEIVSAHMEKAA